MGIHIIAPIDQLQLVSEASQALLLFASRSLNFVFAIYRMAQLLARVKYQRKPTSLVICRMHQVQDDSVRYSRADCSGQELETSRRPAFCALSPPICYRMTFSVLMATATVILTPGQLKVAAHKSAAVLILTPYLTPEDPFHYA